MLQSGYCLRVDFSKGETGGRLTGPFKYDELMGMMEATNYDDIYEMSHFLDVIEDACCGTTRDCI